MIDEEKSKKGRSKEDDEAAVKPDPETLHTTDPQEHMEGPVSSLMQKAKEELENNDSKDEEKEKRKADE